MHFVHNTTRSLACGFDCQADKEIKQNTPMDLVLFCKAHLLMECYSIMPEAHDWNDGYSSPRPWLTVFGRLDEKLSFAICQYNYPAYLIDMLSYLV